MGNRPAMTLPCHEELSKLACDDPQAFEALRDELVADYIRNAPERLQPRLQGIQFRVDAIRRLSRSPLGAAVKIQALMWDSFLRMDQELKNFARFAARRAHPGGEQTELDYAPARSARVIAFQPRSASRNR